MSAPELHLNDMAFDRVPRWWLSTIVVHTDWESMTDGHVAGRSTDVMRHVHRGEHHAREAHEKAVAFAYGEFAGIPELSIVSTDLEALTDPLSWLAEIVAGVEVEAEWQINGEGTAFAFGDVEALDRLVRAADRIVGMSAARVEGYAEISFPWTCDDCDVVDR